MGRADSRSRSRGRARSDSRSRGRRRDSRSRSRDKKNCKGRVVTWRETEGFGFIRPGRGNDVFVHASALRDGTSLREGDEVTFEETWDQRKNKPRAENVRGARKGPSRRDRDRGGRSRSRSPSVRSRSRRRH